MNFDIALLLFIQKNERQKQWLNYSEWSHKFMHHEMPHKAYREYANALLESSRFVWLKLPFMKSQFPYVIYMCVCVLMLTLRSHITIIMYNPIEYVIANSSLYYITRTSSVSTENRIKLFAKEHFIKLKSYGFIFMLLQMKKRKTCFLVDVLCM
jgi:hypothetical protein